MREVVLSSEVPSNYWLKRLPCPPLHLTAGVSLNLHDMTTLTSAECAKAEVSVWVRGMAASPHSHSVQAMTLSLDHCALFLSPNILLSLKNLTTEFTQALAPSSNLGAASSAASSESSRSTALTTTTPPSSVVASGGMGSPDRYRIVIANDSDAEVRWWGHPRLRLTRTPAR